MLLHEVVQFGAQASPKSVALIFEDKAFTFSELWHWVRAAARHLEALDSSGCDVAIVSENSPEMVVAIYACSLANRRAVLGNTRLASPELADLLGDVDPKLVLGSAGHLKRLNEAGFGDGRTLVDLADLAADYSEAAGYSKAAGYSEAAEYSAEASETSTVWVIHTSGTTGRAKPVGITHRSLLTAVTNTAIARHLHDQTVYLMPFPLFHVAAYNLVHAHLRRRPVVLVSKFEPVLVMTAVQTHKVTALSLAPTMLTMMLDHERRSEFDLSSIDTVAYGASAMSPALLERGHRELGCGFAQGYGMTELSGNAVFLDPEDHRAALAGKSHLLSAAGRAGPLCRIGILGSDGAVLGVGETGEIAVKGDQVVPGYIDRPEANEAAFTHDGWFRTGDVGRIDEEGYLYVVDRLKDIIITGGENVSSREVEDVVSGFDGVASAAVIGIPDDTWGERIVAVLTASTGRKIEATEVIDYCKQHLSSFKCPKTVVVLDALPLNGSGKVLKSELRKMLGD